MTRLLSSCAAGLAVVALGAAIWHFSTVWNTWQTSSTPNAAAAAHLSPSTETRTASEPSNDRQWLPVFGVARGTSPQQPQTAPASFDYELKGVVAMGAARWAILTKAGADTLVREGDHLDDESEILEIQAEGVDVVFEGQTVRLGFSDRRPVKVETVEAAPAPKRASENGVVTMLPSAETTHLFFQDISQKDIVAMLLKAEAERREKGLVAEDR